MKLGTIRGIEIKLHFSTLVIVGLVGFYAASFYFSLVQVATLYELIFVGLLNGLIILGSILLHELMHSFVAQNEGMDVNEIEFYMFGGVSKIHEEPDTPKAEAKIAAIGPITSLILGAILLTAFYLIPVLPPVGLVTLFYSGASNIVLGIFNFLPAYPMDGGRVLRSILWKRRGDLISATKTASKVGVYLGYGLVGWGFFQVMFIGLYGGLWLVFIGCFLSNSARQSLQQTIQYTKLSSVNAGSMVSQQKDRINIDLSVQEAINQFFSPQKKLYFPVAQNGNIKGVIDIESVKSTEREERNIKKVGDIMIKSDDLPKIKRTEDGNKAMNKLREMDRELKIITVVDNGQTLGFIGQEEIRNALQFSDLL